MKRDTWNPEVMLTASLSCFALAQSLPVDHAGALRTRPAPGRHHSWALTLYVLRKGPKAMQATPRLASDCTHQLLKGVPALSVLLPHIIPQETREDAVSLGPRAKDPGDALGEISQEALS